MFIYYQEDSNNVLVKFTLLRNLVLPSVGLFVFTVFLLSIRLILCFASQFAYLPTYLSVSESRAPVCLRLCLPNVCMHARLSVCLSVCLQHVLCLCLSSLSRTSVCVHVTVCQNCPFLIDVIVKRRISYHDHLVPAVKAGRGEVIIKPVSLKARKPIEVVL